MIAKVANCALLGVVSYLAFKLFTEKSPVPPVQNTPLSGSSGVLFANLAAFQPQNQSMYAYDSVPFVHLDERTKTMLLQCFSQDYTSPRMIKDDKLYNIAVSCANKTGCPCGWIQFVLDKNPNVDIYKSALAMLEYCDYAIKNNDQVFLDAIRSNAINVGLSK